MLEKYEQMVDAAEEKLSAIFELHNKTAYRNQRKVLTAMRENRLSERHFTQSTGYGYDDDGREVCAKIYAQVFGAEKAIVRPQIVSGTHAITLCLFGILRPGDNMLSLTGKPYDTIFLSIGSMGDEKDSGTLYDYGITYRETDVTEDVSRCAEYAEKLIDEKTKLIYIQRSTGYSHRPALTIDKIKTMIEQIHKIKPDAVIMVDNCYGEFLEDREPCAVGADLMAGSLIKNPGGGLAVSGGYIAGKAEYVDKVMNRLTTPSLGDEVGANLGVLRSYLQGFFMAPSVTNSAVKGAVLTAAVMAEAGYEVFPKVDADRSDIIQAVVLSDPQKVVKYCKGIQQSSPVDAYVEPIPWDMPGYESEVIMAAGNFIQGASIELSADSPMRPPYIVYQQGGLTYEHIKIALAGALYEISH